MNNTQRKELAKTKAELDGHVSELQTLVEEVIEESDVDTVIKPALDKMLVICSKAEDCKSVVASMAIDEEDKYDNMPAGLQASERGEALMAAKEALENASNEIESAVEDLQNELSDNIKNTFVVTVLHDSLETMVEALETAVATIDDVE